ncbi:MAG: hypothetical protein COC08_07460 [Maribacter sp.]|nr:MAG: hypothetical protein COC08_07460 [Maribacter sp.]
MIHEIFGAYYYNKYFRSIILHPNGDFAVIYNSYNSNLIRSLEKSINWKKNMTKLENEYKMLNISAK